MKKLITANGILFVFLITLFSIQVSTAQSKADKKKRAAFNQIEEVKTLVSIGELAKPIIKEELDKSLYTAENEEAFGGQKGVKRLIDTFMDVYKTTYLADEFFNQVKSKYSVDELKSLKEGTANSKLKDRWKSDYDSYNDTIEDVSRKYGETAMLEAMEKFNKK